MWKTERRKNLRPFFYSQYFAGQKTLTRIRNYLGSSRTSLSLRLPAIILIHRRTSVNFSFPWKKIFKNNFPWIFSEQIFHESFKKNFPWIFYSDFILPELSRFCHNYIVDLYREISISVIKKKLSLANLRSTCVFFFFFLRVQFFRHDVLSRARKIGRTRYVNHIMCITVVHVRHMCHTRAHTHTDALSKDEK